jgi:hypothetical protein
MKNPSPSASYFFFHSIIIYYIILSILFFIYSFDLFVFFSLVGCSPRVDQPGLHSDRYVSLQSAMASTSSNRLVTGVRFVKINRILHIQIQEGEALPRGSVNESTVQWLPTPPLTVLKGQEESVEDGLGYATLRYEERAIDLDDLVAPKGHVVTGLRFRKLGF